MENTEKDIKLIQQSKGQLEASIDKVRTYLTDEEFRDYNDALYTCVGYQQLIMKRMKGENTEFSPLKKDLPLI